MLAVREHAVQRCPVAIVRPHLHDIADVDDERVGPRLDELPGAVVVHLKPRLLVLNQDSQRAGVGVAIDAEMPDRCRRRSIGRRRIRAERIVVQAQEARVVRTESPEQIDGWKIFSAFAMRNRRNSEVLEKPNASALRCTSSLYSVVQRNMM